MSWRVGYATIDNFLEDVRDSASTQDTSPAVIQQLAAARVAARGMLVTDVFRPGGQVAVELSGQPGKSISVIVSVT